MFKLPMMFFTISIITGAIVLAAHLLPSRNMKSEKSSPYECGFDPLNSARMPFSFRFFLVAMLFLLFDLEIALLFPLPVSSFFFNPKTTIILSTVFLMMLTLGLMFEWMQGGLDWAE